jgi:hypothetical protein
MPGLDEATGAGDGRAAEVRALGHRIAAIDRECAVVEDGAAVGNAAGGAAIAELQGAAADEVRPV